MGQTDLTVEHIGNTWDPDAAGEHQNQKSTTSVQSRDIIQMISLISRLKETD